MKTLTKRCPCHSGATYTQCCKPLHAGDATAETPTALMRSRYSAYALGLGRYLWETLARSHPERSETYEAFEHRRSQDAALGNQGPKFLGLTIVHAATEPALAANNPGTQTRGTVVFFARIFQGGQERSFAERSTFVCEERAWRYLDGHMLQHHELPKEIAALTQDAWLRLFAEESRDADRQPEGNEGT
jgi:SEC-C motif domain protein